MKKIDSGELNPFDARTMLRRCLLSGAHLRGMTLGENGICTSFCEKHHIIGIPGRYLDPEVVATAARSIVQRRLKELGMQGRELRRWGTLLDRFGQLRESYTMASFLKRVPDTLSPFGPPRPTEVVVTPAKAGVHVRAGWIPAFAGMTCRGNDAHGAIFRSRQGARTADFVVRATRIFWC